MKDRLYVQRCVMAVGGDGKSLFESIDSLATVSHGATP